MSASVVSSSMNRAVARPERPASPRMPTAQNQRPRQYLAKAVLTLALPPSDTDVGRQCQPEAGAQARTVDGRDDRHFDVVQGLDDGVEVLTPCEWQGGDRHANPSTCSARSWPTHKLRPQALRNAARTDPSTRASPWQPGSGRWRIQDG